MIEIVHSLKTRQPYFDAVARGDKTFEVRLNDRCFQRHDLVRLTLFDPAEPFAGLGLGYEQVIEKQITYVLPGGQFGIDPAYVVLGLGPHPARLQCCGQHPEDGHAPGCEGALP